MRLSADEIKDGAVWNGYDYCLQAWVKDGFIQDCCHPEEMRRNHCCNSHRLSGRKILETQGREIRS